MTTTTPWAAYCDLDDESGVQPGDTREEAIERVMEPVVECLAGEEAGTHTGTIHLTREAVWHDRCDADDCRTCDTEADWDSIIVGGLHAGSVRVIVTVSEDGDPVWELR